MTQAVRRKYHYIYKVTRLDEGEKFYIGMHSTDNLEDGYFGSGSLLSRSIKKHGKEKHKKEILEFLPTREALKLREKELVNEELLGDKRCMNLQLGGEGGWTKDVSNLGGATFKKLFDNDEKFRKNHIDHLTRVSKIGRDALQLKYPEGTFKGKHHSESSLLKLKNTYVVTEHQQGEKNSQFGSCWVTNGVKPVKIRKEQLDEYLLNGYSKGRVMKVL